MSKWSTSFVTRLRRRYPSHAVLGEEVEIGAQDESTFIWVVDPIDGTTNYLNGLPLYGCSIGVLYKHFPVVGAVWCASTHTRHPGVYHAFEEGPLSFDGAADSTPRAPMVRGVACEPGAAPRYGAFFDTRVLASASLECAFTAAGMTRDSRTSLAPRYLGCRCRHLTRTCCRMPTCSRDATTRGHRSPDSPRSTPASDSPRAA